MIEIVLFFPLVAVAVSVRRAFVRLDEGDRTSASLRERIAGLEDQLAVIRHGAPQYQPDTAPAPVVLPLPRHPQESGRDRIENEAAGPVRLEPETDEASAFVADFRREAEQAPAPAADAESLETRIGSRWLLYIGIAAIVIGVAYFEKLAIEKQWLGETARVIQGAVIGLALTVVGLRFVRAGYDAYGQMIAGGGAAILYLSTYAAFNFYHLIDQPVAFALMVAITALVAWLADRLHSQGSRSSPSAAASRRRSSCPATATRRSPSSATTRS